MLFSKIITVISLMVIISACASFGGSRKFNFINGQAFNVPEIVRNNNWVQVGHGEDLLGPENIVWHSVAYYEYSEKRWFMSKHSFFGQEIFRAFGVHDDQLKLQGHWFYFNKENKWYLVESDKMESRWIRASTAIRERIGIEIWLLDKNKNIIISTSVYKK